MKVLIIDSDIATRTFITDFLVSRSHEVNIANNASEGLQIVKNCQPDLVFLANELPEAKGSNLLQIFHTSLVGASLIVIATEMPLDQAVLAMKNGADYVMQKPLDVNLLTEILTRLEDRFLAASLAMFHGMSDFNNENIIGKSPLIIKLHRLIELLARNISTPVLIYGESGSGKQLVAKAIHKKSGVSGPLVEINCASLSENLLESELFGHERGAFTDAKEVKKGLFEIAQNGTIFFDELAEMPISIQAKLLKVLDSGCSRRVGGVTDQHSNARFMAATNKDLALMVKKGLFREDLYYRVNVLPVIVPPLRARGEDIIILAEYFMRNIGASMGKRRVSITPLAVDMLTKYIWPGNVRELKNVIERSLILSEKDYLQIEHFPPEINKISREEKTGGGIINFNKTLRQVEEEYIVDVLNKTNNNHSRTANILGISRSTLLARLKKIHLPTD